MKEETGLAITKSEARRDAKKAEVVFVGNPIARKNSNPGDFKSNEIFAHRAGIPIPENPRDSEKSRK